MPFQSVSVEAVTVTVSVRVTAKPTKTFLSILNIQSFSFCSWELVPTPPGLRGRPCAYSKSVVTSGHGKPNAVCFGVGEYRTPGFSRSRSLLPEVSFQIFGKFADFE